MHLAKVKSCFQVLLCWTGGSFKFLISKTSDKVFYENSSIRFVSSLILKIAFSRIPCFNIMVIILVIILFWKITFSCIKIILKKQHLSCYLILIFWKLVQLLNWVFYYNTFTKVLFDNVWYELFTIPTNDFFLIVAVTS